LIFDEVMTGFRVAWGGVQTMLQLSPDITTLGKVIGGGMPLAAYGGRADIMDQIAPAGPVYQAGTLSGNPVAVAAGLKTLELLDMPSVYSKLGDMSQRLMSGFQNLAQDFGLPMQTDFEGGMFGFFFRSRPVHNYDDAKGCDIELFKKFFHQMLNAGIYLAPSAFEAGFLSLAHTEQDIQQTLAMARQSMESLTSNDS
jgi:glutamate-1-semialdehyde 2,1-aminomutase